jgi:predicted site-specific integrase-resolvase
MEQVLPQNGAFYAEETSASAPPYEAELVEDILSLMASFSAKIYGSRAITVQSYEFKVQKAQSKLFEL